MFEIHKMSILPKLIHRYPSLIKYHLFPTKIRKYAGLFYQVIEGYEYQCSFKEKNRTRKIMVSDIKLDYNVLVIKDLNTGIKAGS